MWLRIEQLTRRILVVSEPGYTTPPPNGQADYELIIESWPGPYFQCRLSADHTSVEIDPALVPEIFVDQPVRSAVDVDVVTASRIRSLIGGVDPIQEQLKYLRLVIWAQWVNAHPTDFTEADKSKADTIISTSLALDSKIEKIRAEGTLYKKNNKWI